MKAFIFFMIMATGSTFTGCSQTNNNKEVGSTVQLPRVGGDCEGCEAVYESDIPFEKLTSVDTVVDFLEAGPKIEISGIIYKAGGRTPAKDVVLYFYHTDQKGRYPTRGNETGWGKRHGFLRGWVKSDYNGFYKFYTLVPASYPDGKNPKHIHPIIKEADKNEYWIDEFLFDDDPNLSKEERKRANPRGGSGILKTYTKDGMLRAKRNIILGLNVPRYPVAKKTALQSGLSVGEGCPAFDPLHLSGADKGTSACPMCKYGYGQGIMVWFNHDDFGELEEFVLRFEKEMKAQGEKKLRVFFVYMNPSYKSNDAAGEKILQRKIRDWCAAQGLEKVAMVWVPSPFDEDTCGLFKINPKVKNTVFMYKKRKVVAKWVDMDYNDETLNSMLKRLGEAS